MNCTLSNNHLDLYKNKATKLHIYLPKEDNRELDFYIWYHQVNKLLHYRQLIIYLKYLA